MPRQITLKHVLATALLCIAALALLAILLEPPGFLVRREFRRHNPLINPVAVLRIEAGALHLEDGQVLRPAGITPIVPPDQFDAALRVITAQGIVITRDLLDGSAFMHAEPRIIETCGNCRRRRFTGLGWTENGGWFHQVPLSELLIATGYADPSPDLASDNPTARVPITPRERWRLRATVALRGGATGPDRLVGNAGFSPFDFPDELAEPELLDENLAYLTTPPPD